MYNLKQTTILEVPTWSHLHLTTIYTNKYEVPTACAYLQQMGICNIPATKPTIDWYLQHTCYNSYTTVIFARAMVLHLQHGMISLSCVYPSKGLSPLTPSPFIHFAVKERAGEATKIFLRRELSDPFSQRRWSRATLTNGNFVLQRRERERERVWRLSKLLHLLLQSFSCPKL